MNKKILLLGLIIGITALFLAVRPTISPSLPSSLLSPSEKTYTNPKYGFEFKLPSDWQVEEWDIEQAAKLTKVPDGTILYQGKFFGKKEHFEVLIWGNKGKAPVRSWLTWFRHEDLDLKALPNETNYAFAGFPSIRYVQKTTSRKKPILYIFFTKDDKLFELICERPDLEFKEATQSSQLVHPIYDKLLQSFYFVVN